MDSGYPVDTGYPEWICSGKTYIVVLGVQKSYKVCAVGHEQSKAVSVTLHGCVMGRCASFGVF